MSYTNTAEGDIIITQGDSGMFVMELKDKDNQPRDLTGLTATLSVAKARINDNGESVIAAPFIVKTIDPNLNAEGEKHIIRFVFQPEDTDLVKPGEYVYDVELTDGGPFVWTILSRTFTVEYQVTRRA